MTLFMSGVTLYYDFIAPNRSAVEHSAAETTMVTIDHITMRAPTTIVAGTPFTVTLSSQPSVDRANVTLFLLNTNGTQLLTGNLQQGLAHIPIAAPITEISGEMELVAHIGSHSARATVSIVPGEAVEPVLALVGPRSITADGEHWTMLTALPKDRFGNAVADETPVTVRVSHPAADGATNRTQIDTVEVLTAKTKYLLAWVRVFSRTNAGRMYMAAASGDAHSPERTAIAVPGPPVAFGLQAEMRQRDADGRRLITVETERLQDRFGNPLLDGTAVTFLVTNPDGTTRSLPTQSIDGTARVQIQAPAIPGSINIEALVLNTTSRPLTFDFNAGIGVAPIAIRAIPTDDLLTLIAGPLLGPLDQYIPDGSEVIFTIQSEESGHAPIEVTAPASAGFATAVIRANTLTAGRYRVLVQAGIGEGEIVVEVEK